MKMARKYKFTAEEIVAIEAARKRNKDKRVEARLKALELWAKGHEAKEVSQMTGFHAASVPALVAKYREKGLEYLSVNHYNGNRRNMSVEQEAEILAPFEEQAEQGEVIEISIIKAAYQAQVDHTIADSQIYHVLRRHGWSRIMPRSKYVKKQARGSCRPQRK